MSHLLLAPRFARALVLPAVLALSLSVGAPALAAPQADGDGHHYYTDDDDHDGIANWADPDSDMFALTGLLFHLINVTILFGGGYFLIRRPVRDTVRERALAIRTEITDSARTRDEAEKRYQELEARLTAITGELETMRAQAREEARIEEEKLIERARQEAERIAQTAQRNIRDEMTRARLELRREAVDLAVQLAENTLRDQVAHDDQLRLAREFLDSLNQEGVRHV